MIDLAAGNEVRVSAPSSCFPYIDLNVHWKDFIRRMNGQCCILVSPSDGGGSAGWTIRDNKGNTGWVPLVWLDHVERQGCLFL